MILESIYVCSGHQMYVQVYTAGTVIIELYRITAGIQKSQKKAILHWPENYF